MTMMAQTQNCSLCGRVSDAELLCPSCATGMAMLMQPAPDATRVGDYELLQLLGEGGMGRVYRARSARTQQLCALKLARPRLIEDEAGAIAFRRELEIARDLKHPNIVRIFDVGEDAARPYLVMDLLAGGTLADWEPSDRHAPYHRVVVDLVIQITEAVQQAHAQGVLHCDLKPKNILFDEAGQPHVGDFGLARALRAGTEDRSRTWVGGGSPGWMSPEQVRGDQLTTASDIFNLGLLLHWLLTRQHAFGCDERFGWRVLHEAPQPLDPKVPWELHAICSKALQREPKQRYGSAGELAADLICSRSGRAIQAEQRRPLRRFSKWVRRHVVASTLGIELLALLAYLAFVPMSVVDNLAKVVGPSNAFSARQLSQNVTVELSSRAARVLHLAGDLSLSNELESCDPQRTSEALLALAGDFDSVWVFDLEGALCRSWPVPRVPLQPSYDWRDYFVGQRQLAQAQASEVYVARAIRDDVDGELKLAYATPIYANGKPVAALVATSKTRATFGRVQLNCSRPGTCMTALLGPRDRDHSRAELPGHLIVIAEPGLKPGHQVVVPSPIATRICREFGCEPRIINPFEASSDDAVFVEPDYRDPVSGQRSTAAIAPVAHTGMSVVVATPYSGVMALGSEIDLQLRAWLWIPLSLGLVLVALLISVTGVVGIQARRTSLGRERVRSDSAPR